MELKELKLKNFGCFYGENIIKFSPSLTLIIGDNGDGKTTLLDALKWLLDITHPTTLDVKRISEKLFIDLEEGASEEVGVELLCEHQGQLVSLKKYFFISKQEGTFKFPDKANLVAYIENYRGERTWTDMDKWIEASFDPSIQEFCLFKGEAELDVLNNKEGLGKLLNRFSEISQIDSYMRKTLAIAARADKAALDERRRSNRSKREFDEITEEINRLKDEQEGIEEKILRAEDELNASQSLFDSLKTNEAVWEEYQELNEEKTKTMGEISSLMSRTDVNPNINLLDELWILKDFDGVFEEFKNKASYWREQRHNLELERIKEEAKIEQSVEISKEIKSKLPIQIPDVSTLETLIAAERCEICGRDAPKGTPAYQHMCDRLKELREYLAGLPKEEPKLPPLFIADHIGEINAIYRALTGETQADLNRKLQRVDTEMCQLNKDRKSLQEKHKELEEWRIKIQNLLIVNNIKDEDKFFGPTQQSFFASKENIGRATGKKEELEEQRNLYIKDIDELKAKLRTIAADNPHVVFLSRVSEILNDLSIAFKEGREENADQFVKKLEQKANKYFDLLNAKDFHGFIRLNRKEGTDEIKIQLQSSSGKEIPFANTAQKTSEYLAVLFAISELGHNKNDEVYPLVFDAPTSSFSAGKEGDFYNVISQFQKQCVILTKDLLKPDGTLDLARVEKLNCNVIRIQQMPTFVQGDIATVQTEIKEVKV